MTRVEKKFLETQELMVVRGKKGRGAPVIIPADLNFPLKYLTTASVRDAAGIISDNKFLFPNSRFLQVPGTVVLAGGLNTAIKQFKDDADNSLLLGEKYDAIVKDWVTKVRTNGGIINRRIVMAVAEGVLLKHDKTNLPKYGGNVQITDAWAKSFLTRLGFAKRKCMKDTKCLPEDFTTIQENYLKRIRSAMDDNNIPDDLVINWDQTGLSMVPGGQWTMETKGARQITVTGIDDKRQNTALLAMSKAGILLPPQLIYDGKSARCHPKFTFPQDWDITHIDNHWSNGGFHAAISGYGIVAFHQETAKSAKTRPQTEFPGDFRCLQSPRESSTLTGWRPEYYWCRNYYYKYCWYL